MNHEIFIISRFFKSSGFGFRSKKVYFSNFWLIFYPLDPDSDPDPGSQNPADPTDPDPKHSFLPTKTLKEKSFPIFTLDKSMIKN